MMIHITDKKIVVDVQLVYSDVLNNASDWKRIQKVSCIRRWMKRLALNVDCVRKYVQS